MLSQQNGNPSSSRFSDYLSDKTLVEVVKQLEQEIRKQPTVIEKRLFLFQLMVVMGEWQRALQQLQVCVGLDKEMASVAHIYGDLVRSEFYRNKVFSGEISPRFLQEPPTWCAGFLRSLVLQAQNSVEKADQVRSEALNQIPECSGVIYDRDNNQYTFAWLIDADSRLGPIIELILNGQYMWLALNQIKKIRIEPPYNLCDVVWVAAEITLKNGDEVSAFVPVRYPHSETANDGVKLARITTWCDVGATATIGMGQRMWMTDIADFSLLDTNNIVFN